MDAFEETAFLSSLMEPDGRRRLATSSVVLERKLSEGKLSESYLGTHEGLNLPVIVRVMKPEIRTALGEETYLKLGSLCQQYARVRDASITAIYDVGTHHGYPFTVVEYVSGVPLLERISDRPLTEAETLGLFVPIAHGLASLWRHDVMHRGVSPLRILVTSEGVPKLDIVILPRVPLEELLVSAHKPFMAGFWPPEELKRSLDIDPRSDVFSFGASMYFALTGVSPYGAGSVDERIQRTLERAPTDIAEHVPDLNTGLRAFVMRCLNCDRTKRFDCVTSFLDELGELQSKITGRSEHARVTFGPGLAPARPHGEIGAGATLGQCILEEKVGAGAFGIVYKARHRILDIALAVKLLPKDLASRNPEYISLFLREARTAIRIRHKHVIGLYEAGEQEGQYYLIMEFAPGKTVADKMQGFPQGMSEDAIRQVLRETALGLAAAEEMGIIHRDIKPENLMYGAGGEVKIADLGLAKRILLPAANGTDSSESIRREQLTMISGEPTIQGTPAYMAPEMAMTPDRVDHRADLYSLGVTAYHMATGKLPFSAPQPFQVLVLHSTQLPVSPRQHRLDLSESLEAVILKLMEKSPANRFAHARDLAAAV